MIESGLRSNAVKSYQFLTKFLNIQSALSDIMTLSVKKKIINLDIHVIMYFLIEFTLLY